MRNIIETTVQVPQEKLAALLADPANNSKWMVDLEAYEPLDNKPGDVGAKYRLTFRSGKRTMSFNAQTTKRDLPKELSLSMDSPVVHLVASARFTALSPTTTRYVSDQTFTFKGLGNKIFGFLAAGAIKKQQRRDMEAFKAFAEQKSD